MVATRRERTQKRLQQENHPPHMRFKRTHMARTAPQPTLTAYASTDTVWNYAVRTTAQGEESIATPWDPAVQSARITFRGPAGVVGDSLHDLALRFLSRRGSDYLPSDQALVITLDVRGRQRVLEHI